MICKHHGNKILIINRDGHRLGWVFRGASRRLYLLYTTSPNGTSCSATSAALHSWIHYGWAYLVLWKIHVLGLVYRCLDMKNTFSSSSVSLSLWGFQLQALGKFFASETPLTEVALCQQYLALWVIAGIFRSIQVRRLGAQSLFCLVSSLFLAHQHFCKATDAQYRHFLLASNLREITDNLMAQSFLFL